MRGIKRVVIVGGGIAGLAAAYRLTLLPGFATPPPSPVLSAQERGEGPGVGGEVAITLIEADARLGGKIVTERAEDFVIEGGPDSFLAFKPRGLGLCRELGLEGRLHGTNEKIRRTYVMRGGKLYELPEGLTGLVPSRLGPLLKTGLISPFGKLHVALDYVIPPPSVDGDESLAAFVERRFGREVYDRLIEPLMSGIYAGNGRQLSLAATFPQLKQAEREHGSLIKGTRSANKKMPAPSGAANRAAFLTLTSGLAEIVERLAARLRRVDIRLRTRATRVSQSLPDGGYTLTLANGESLRADAIIFATPAFATADLISNLDSQLADTLSAIPYVSTATISVAYPLSQIPRPLDGYGYIVPRAEGRAVLACTWASTKFPRRAPEGFGLIRAFIGRAGQEGLLDGTDEDLLELVREELRATLGIMIPPILSRIFRWPKAMPQYMLGHLDRLAAIERRLAEHPGLFIAGSAYRGIGIPDCIASGEQAAEKALAYAQPPVHI